MSLYQEYSDRIVEHLNQLIDTARAYQELLEDEARAEERKERPGFHRVRMRMRVSKELDDLIEPLETLILDRVIRIVDRYQSLETINRDEDFV